jgi:hypothetical protein
VSPLREDRVGQAGVVPTPPRGCSVGAEFVVGVGDGFELEGGVLDVEVPGDAGLQLVQQPRSAAVGEAGVVKSRYA